MGNFGRPGGFAGKRPYGGRPQGDREMFDAVCANCNRPTQVPFRPNGTKPVYCKECFADHTEGDRAPRRDFDRRDAPPRRTFERRDFTPAAPAAAPRTVTPDPRIDTLQRDVKTLTAKIDTLVDMLRARELKAVVAKVVAPKVAKKKAPKKK